MDAIEAGKWFVRAAAQGYRGSLFNTGTAFMSGDYNLLTDQKRAILVLKKVADPGHSMAISVVQRHSDTRCISCEAVFPHTYVPSVHRASFGSCSHLTTGLKWFTKSPVYYLSPSHIKPINEPTIA